MRSALASAAVCALCLASGAVAHGLTGWKLPPPQQRARDLAHAYDKRFAVVRDRLPSDTRIVGYWTDQGDLSLASYALAPVLLDEAKPPSRELVLVDLHTKAPPDPSAFAGYVLVEDFGQGLALLRRGAP